MRTLKSVIFIIILASCSKNTSDDSNTRRIGFVEQVEAHVQPIIRNEIINVDSIKKYIPINSKEKLISGTGKTKTLWKIAGSELGQFEIIGNNQLDADQIGWHTPEFDEQGNALGLANSKITRAIFSKVLSLYLNNAEAVADDMFIEIENTGSKTVTRASGDLSIESDGLYSFIRRSSRR